MQFRIFACLIILTFTSCQGNKEQEREINDLVTTGPTEDIIEDVIPIDMRIEQIDGEAIPLDCDYDGYLFDCWRWEDTEGVNYLFRTLEEPRDDSEDSPEDYVFIDEYLHVYHYRKTSRDEMMLIRELTDFIKDCEFDSNVSHLAEVELTDVDQDYIGEVTFGYRLACRSDVSPSDQKVILFEDGEKYILRGTSEVYGYGGDYEAGAEFDDANPDFLYQVAAYWDKYKVEFE